MSTRLHRRLVGWLRARLPDAGFDQVADPRRAHGRKWPIGKLLSATAVAMAAGMRGLRQVEAFTREASWPALRALGLRGRLPDTTARDALIKVDPHELRAALHRLLRRAHRRHALDPDGLRWGVVSMDGKATAIDAWDSPLVQRQGQRGIVRTVTATLVSSHVRVCLDAFPIPAATNEMGIYPSALDALLDAYSGLDLFRVVMYDAGACSEANARHTRKRGLHYVMVLNEGQPTLADEARKALSALGSERGTVVQHDDSRTVRYTLWSTDELAAWPGWDHLRTVIRIQREVLDAAGRVTQTGERYFVTSLRPDALSAMGWARMLRSRWGVENDCHNTFDAILGEDAQTWFRLSASGALNVILLRRLVYNLLALFRGRTLRGELGSRPPWRDLMRWTYNALIAATEATVAELRPRAAPT